MEHDKYRTVSEADGERLVNGLYTMRLAVGLSTPDTTDGTVDVDDAADDGGEDADGDDAGETLVRSFDRTVLSLGRADGT